MSMKKRTKVLIVLLAVFTAGTGALYLPEPKTADTAVQKVYYLTAYESSADLLAVQVTNETGSLAMVNYGGEIFTDTALAGIEPDIGAVNQLFETVSKIQVSEPIEGADPKDPQFGLREPAAVIFLEDIEQSGLQFEVGGLVPGGSAYYMCMTDGNEVYTISSDYASAFLGSVQQYLDLSVFSESLLANMQRIAVYGAGAASSKLAQVTADASASEGSLEPLYELTATGKSEITGISYFSFTKPAALPLSNALYQEQLLSSLQTMRAVDVREAAGEGEKTGYRIEIEDSQGEAISFLMADFGSSHPLVINETTGVLYEIDPSTAELKTSARELLGGKLLSLSTANITSITLEAGGKTADISVKGSGKAYEITVNGENVSQASFAGEYLDRLNDISIEDLASDLNAEEVRLSCSIQMRDGSEALNLVFESAKGRKCVVSVNGTRVFSCDLSAVQPLITAVTG